MRFRTLIAFAATLIPFASQATQIQYSLENLGSSTYQYAYTITNDSLGTAIQEFTIDFALGQYASLAPGGVPVGWDISGGIVQPDPNLPADGFADFLSLGADIAPGATLGGFLVRFAWFGAGTPGSQAFTIVDQSNYAVPLDSGLTTLAQVTSVPEPGIATLFVLGIGVLAFSFRVKRRV